jgi:ABC-type branched-subunit amino acid transport system substrate-binding protein
MKPQTKSTYGISLKLILCILCLFVAEAAGQDSLELRQSRGRQIYTQGTSRSGKDVLAYIGDASLEVPASTIPCAGCHGFDGRGKPEGGVNPSNVTWEFLTKPYGLKHASGRQHPPYTERALELAITRGVDPGGNKLLQVMPRYVMSREDLADLVAYLQLIGKEQAPGVTENKIVIGTLVPASGYLAEMGQVITAATKAVFAELNSQGGIYGRQLELQVIETPDGGLPMRDKVEPVLQAQQVFAMSAAMLVNTEKEIVPLFSKYETPLIGPISLYPQTGFPLTRQVFYVSPGMDDLSRALISFIAQKPEFKSSNWAVISHRSDLTADIIEAIKKKLAPNSPTVVEYAMGAFDEAETIKRTRPAEVIFFLGPAADALSFMIEAEKLNWFPTILAPGGIIGSGVFEAPKGFDRKMFFSVPTAPEHQTPEGWKEYQALVAKYKLPSYLRVSQGYAIVAAKILIEGLKRVGNDLSRERFIQEIEKLHEYPTGLMPAVTYGPNRRRGSTGAHIVTADLKGKKLVPVSAWIDGN